jgi:hypothetical protein
MNKWFKIEIEYKRCSRRHKIFWVIERDSNQEGGFFSIKVGVKVPDLKRE